MLVQAAPADVGHKYPAASSQPDVLQVDAVNPEVQRLAWRAYPLAVPIDPVNTMALQQQEGIVKLGMLVLNFKPLSQLQHIPLLLHWPVLPLSQRPAPKAH